MYLRIHRWLFLAILVLGGCETKTKVVDRCGDGFLDPGEQCDGSLLGEQTCLSLGYYVDGQLACRSDCSFDTSECGGRCGDGYLDGDEGESCDLFELDGQTCESLGFGGGALSCRPDCSFNLAGCVSECGDGEVEPDEGCDDGGREDGDGCDAYCRVEPGYACDEEPSVCGAVCGDHLIAADEVCDLTTLGGFTCEVLGYYGGTLSCLQDCHGFDESACQAVGRCGDGAVQTEYDEECDLENLNSATCVSLGYSQGSGALACLQMCEFDETLCVPRSANAELVALGVDQGQMTPAFSASIRSYSVTVLLSVETMTVTATAEDPWATVTFSPAQPMSLVVGQNPVTVTVTAEDGTQKVTTLMVNRQATLNYESPNVGTMIYVPAGTFQRDPTPQNLSAVSAFRMSRNEITRAQWTAVTGWADPSIVAYSSGQNDPVQNVNSYHAMAFCNKLSLLEGLTPVYSVSGVDFTTLTFEEIPVDNDPTWDAATADWNSDGYRLPTDMEWLWAAMGADLAAPGAVNTTGYTKLFPGDTGSNFIGDYAVYGYNDGVDAGRTTTERSNPVGSKLPNELGFHDLGGNVFEWLWDWYNTYPQGLLTDYRGSTTTLYRLLRGGNWRHSQLACRLLLGNATIYWPSSRTDLTGFRVVRL